MRKWALIPAPDGPFAALDLTARAVFGLVWDRWRLSSAAALKGDERFVALAPPDGADCDGVFACYRQAELAAQLGVSERTVRRALDELERLGLVYRGRKEYGGSMRLHVGRAAFRWLKT